MNFNLKKLEKLFSKNKNLEILCDSKFGLEIEKTRISEDGKISQKKHPESLGSPLTNPYISTDFAEAQLEIITAPLKNKEKLKNFLEKTFKFIYRNIDEEFLWPASMPYPIKNEKEILIGQYGNSKNGKKKTIYREGLGQRYGKKMQTVCGIHFNFSFSEGFWDLMYKEFAGKKTKQDFINESYLSIQRNFLRYHWLNTYLFGASPAMDKSYIKRKTRKLKKLAKKTYYGEYASSLRMSKIGYYSRIQNNLAISINSLNQYIEDLKKAITTPHPKYRKLTQLNNNILQVESEFYTPIRAKVIMKKGESYLEALEKRGIEYIEVRAVDIDPLDPIGISMDQMDFLHILLIYSLFKKSPFISEKEYKEITENQNNTALYGRKENLNLIKDSKKKLLRDWGIELIKDMQKIAKFLDKNKKTKSHSLLLDKQIEKLKNPELNPSAIILKKIKEEGEYYDFGISLAKKYKDYFIKKSFSKKEEDEFKKIAKESLISNKKLEFESELYLEGYEDLEISTQILMKEALKREVEIEVLDRKESFIRLSKGKTVEYVKQATKTSLDSYITYLLMENKHITKQILEEEGINTPKGGIYSNIDAAINDYKNFKNKDLIIKPNTTNFGIGISLIKKNDRKEFEKDIKNAFKHGDQIIVEEYFSGEEYRFLVIGGDLLSVVKRDPANVIGDGKKTIRQLVKEKNEQRPSYPIILGQKEKEKLKEEKLNFDSKPKKGEKIYLRFNTNVSTGGESIDCTNEIPKEFHKIAIKAANSVNAEICGLDMIIKDLKKPANKENYTILELNFNPSLYIHTFLPRGKSRDVAGPILDLLGF